MTDIGDFTVSDFALNFARDKQATRSEEARALDEEKRAPVTTDAGEWAQNPSQLDFPGIDTPTENPHLLPKDLMDPAKTDVSAKAKGKSERGDLPKPERNTDAPITETARLSSQDISLSPEEAFEGVGATSSNAAGGFNSTYGGEQRPYDELDDVL
jgi:hypothetical protein